MYKTTLLIVNVIFEGHARVIIKKSPVNLAIYRTLCGERGIRTPGTSQYAGFQDRCIRPLCHLSLLEELA